MHTFRDLLVEAGRDAEDKVAAALKRWRQPVRETIRALTGMKLAGARSAEREQLQIAVRIRDAGDEE
jgi:hypothetical protein